jgi:Helix-turn-helix domain
MLSPCTVEASVASTLLTLEGDMAKVNVSQAAQMAGVSRSTIHKHLNTGKLSADRMDGKTLIDVSELERVFGTLVPPGTLRPNRRDTHPEIPQITAILQAQIDLLQRELDVTRHERDRLLTIIERQALPAGKGWWRRWWG